MTNGYKKLGKEREDAVIRMFLRGNSIPHIAGCFGCSRAAVYGALKRHGIEPTSVAIVKCPYCGKEHQVKRRLTDLMYARYCSKGCMRNHYDENSGNLTIQVGPDRGQVSTPE